MPRQHFVSLQKDDNKIVQSATRHTREDCPKIHEGQEVREFMGGAYYRQAFLYDGHHPPFETYQEHRVAVELCARCFDPETYKREHEKCEENESVSHGESALRS